MLYDKIKPLNDTFPVPARPGAEQSMEEGEVEAALPAEYVHDANQHCFKYIYDDGVGKYDIKIYMTDDESTVEQISYTYWTR